MISERMCCDFPTFKTHLSTVTAPFDQVSSEPSLFEICPDLLRGFLWIPLLTRILLLSSRRFWGNKFNCGWRGLPISRPNSLRTTGKALPTKSNASLDACLSPPCDQVKDISWHCRVILHFCSLSPLLFCRPMFTWLTRISLLKKTMSTYLPLTSMGPLWNR